MNEKSERLDRFKKNPANFPFIKKEEEVEKADDNSPKKKKRRLPIRFKKSQEINRTYDQVQRKNPVNLNGITKQNNTDAMNVLTAPTQMIINSAITALFSMKKNEGFKFQKALFEIDAPKETNVEEKEALRIGFNNDKVGFPNKTFWNDVDWEWATKKHPNFMNKAKSLAESTKTEAAGLLEKGYSVKQIEGSKNEIEVKRAFELIHDKSKELFKSAFEEQSKKFQADFTDVKDVKEFVAKLNHETGRKMSPLDMVINIILVKEAKGESTEKEREGLFNYLQKENIEIDIKKSVKDFSKAVEKGIESGILVVGKSMEVAGQAVEVTGKTVEATGQGIQAVGEAMQAVPVVGNIIGGGLIATGTAVEGAGKGISSAGEGITKTGEEISKQAEKTDKSALGNKNVKIIGFREVLSKAIQLEQEIDKTSEPSQNTELIL